MPRELMKQEGPPPLLPIFPLTGSLLLPGSFLPLHIFEQRYRNMVEDALEGSPFLGMIQPRIPRPDNQPQPGAEHESPELYPVGCVGRIEESEKMSDGRFLIVLKGISRFRILEELPPKRGYRRVLATYDEFTRDLQEIDEGPNPERLLDAFEKFARQHELSFDPERLQALSGVALLNGLSIALPFRPEEKQALLEAPDPAQREEVFLSLIRMGLRAPSQDPPSSPTIH
jgi:Lon protease-like protein